MKTYSVHEQPHPVSDPVDRADQIEFVKDGFSWMTAVFPPLGFAAHGLWFAVIGYLFLVGVIAGIGVLLSVGDDAIGLLLFGLHVFLAFELSTLKRWWLDRQGWTMLGTVSGKSLDECERRFFESWTPVQSAVSAPSLVAPSPSSLSPRSSIPKTVGWPFTGKA